MAIPNTKVYFPRPRFMSRRSGALMSPVLRPSALHSSTRAAAVGRFAVSILLTLVFGAGASAADGDRRVADAAQRRDWNLVRSLLKQKANVKGTQADGATALHWAAHYNAV